MIGITGTILTLVGFGLTLWQLNKTKSSADAAREAVTDVKSRVATYDAVSEVSRVSSAIRETQRHLKATNWESVIESYSVARGAITKLMELPSPISTDDREKLSSMLTDIVNVCDRVEAGIIKNRVTVDRGKALKASRDHSDTINRIEIVLQKEIV